MTRVIVEEQVAKARVKIGDTLELSTYLEDNGIISGLGAKGKICCPVHNESSPSFFYDDVKKDFNCFGCHAKGSVVELHWHLEKKKDSRYTIFKSIVDLSKKYNIKIPDLYKIDYEEIKNEKRQKVRERGKKKDPELEEEMYRQKLLRLEGRYTDIPLKSKILVAYEIDKMWLGRVSAKESYKKVKKVINDANKKMLEKELGGGNDE